MEPVASEQIVPSELLDRLRNETRAAHLKLEEGIGFSRWTMTEAGVRRFMERMHGFFRVWKPWVVSSPIEPGLIAPRLKLGLLDTDLRVLGVADPWRLPVYPVPLGPATLENVMGSLYVIEGSTLGGLVIRKWLRNLSWVPVGGFAYFNSYGDEATAMWRGFRESLAVAAGSARAEAVIQSANDTFAGLYEWHCQARDHQ